MQNITLSILILASAQLVSATPLLQEVFYDADGSDGAGVFTEILGTAGFMLDGWTLVGVNGANGRVYRTVALDGAVIPHDGLLVVATGAAANGLELQRDFIGSVDWQNGPDAVQLLNPTGTIIDALQYGVAPTHGGFGAPAPDPGAGLGLTRDVFGTDTRQNFRDFTPSTPTPGTLGTNAKVPAPTPLALVLVGLYGLAPAWRRRSQKAPALARGVPADSRAYESS